MRTYTAADGGRGVKGGEGGAGRVEEWRGKRAREGWREKRENGEERGREMDLYPRPLPPAPPPFFPPSFLPCTYLCVVWLRLHGGAHVRWPATLRRAVPYRKASACSHRPRTLCWRSVAHPSLHCSVLSIALTPPPLLRRPPAGAGRTRIPCECSAGRCSRRRSRRHSPARRTCLRWPQQRRRRRRRRQRITVYVSRRGETRQLPHTHMNAGARARVHTHTHTHTH